MMIDHVLRFNLEAAPEKLAELARVSARAAARQGFVAWLRELKADDRHRST